MEARLEPAVNSFIIIQLHEGWRKLHSFTSSFGKGGKFSFGFLRKKKYIYIFAFNPVLNKVSFSKGSFQYLTSFIMPHVDFDVKCSDEDPVIGI